MKTNLFILLTVFLLGMIIYPVLATDPWEGYIPSSLSGAEPYVINFTDLSYNSPTAWQWWFKDVTGNNTPVMFNTTQNPSHTFIKGNYSIWLNASNSGGYNITPSLVFANITGLVTDFTASPRSGSSPLSLSFFDSSSNTPTTWKWYWFANETVSSTSQNPTTSLTTGTYNIRLNASNAYRFDWENKTGYVVVTVGVVAPVSNFTADTVNGTAPLTVHFTDSSTNYPTSWYWVFDGVNTSSSQDPMHIYAGVGLFTVTLQVQNTAGSNVKTRTNYINVSAAPLPPSAPIAHGSCTPLTGSLPVLVTCTDTSTNTPTSWNWSVEGEHGMNMYNTSKNPTFTFPYTVSGRYDGYDLTLNASNSAGSDLYFFNNNYFYFYNTPAPTPTPTVTVTPIITPSGSGPQITGWASLTSNGVNITVEDIYGDNVWLVYGQNSNGYTWITANFTATGGEAIIVLQGSPLFGNTRYFARAVDESGMGNEIEFSTAQITPLPTTTFGKGYKDITGMR